MIVQLTGILYIQNLKMRYPEIDIMITPNNVCLNTSLRVRYVAVHGVFKPKRL